MMKDNETIHLEGYKLSLMDSDS